MSNPVLTTGYGQFYYICDRDPTSTELDVLDPANSGVGVYVNISDFKYMWVNTATNDIFWCTDNTFNNMIWEKDISNLNLLSSLVSAGWELNTLRNYIQRSTPLFNTGYIPNINNDTFVLAEVNILISILQTSTISAQIDTGSGFVTIATTSSSSVGINNTSTLSFTVPANATYQIVDSGTGTNTLNSILELSL